MPIHLFARGSEAKTLMARAMASAQPSAQSIAAEGFETAIRPAPSSPASARAMEELGEVQPQGAVGRRGGDRRSKALENSLVAHLHASPKTSGSAEPLRSWDGHSIVYRPSFAST
jgi:hypothetical protein